MPKVAWLLMLQSFVCSAGPDAVKYIVNHAVVQAIFCVPQTLNIVSFSMRGFQVSFNNEKKNLISSREDSLNNGKVVLIVGSDV